ncbi:Efflux RND transporter periplasmic adaptor subunit [Rhodovastum atsumiense]|uniref:Efflux RND transporter periplasmic adaptor subunit n=1 Tax=Rhodovastum atsumiense TaxID=504468 RepID=A0A5M6ING7_9PROT|nr:efflux RND transporter periplasmic adaptor subunit [Rhodovastum atsumiense]KAA5609527.1 efflux RND transporter periplasmic adaptor subunit [Rhodovastum atsumiense]CAH2604944.1 Efflux RND transporter periplasmic adaptor subunit [Rhodovastum atsumiense]
MQPPFRKSLALLTLLLATSALPAAAQSPPPAVTVAPPERRNVTEWDEHLARLEPSARVELRARVSGQVEQVHFRDGQVVRAGELLFTLDRRPFEIAVAAAKAEVASAQAKLDHAGQELERTLPLVRDRVAPVAQLDARRATLRDATAALDAARARQRNAELELSWTEIRAPNAGRVSDRRVDPGNQVQQNSTLLTTIVTLDPIYAVFDMSEADYLRLARHLGTATRPADGQGAPPVELRLADEQGWDRQGRMDFLDTTLDPRSGTLRARALVSNPELFLTPGLFARLRLRVGESDALLVPEEAVAADQAARIVLTVAADGTVVPKPVSLGPVVDGLRVVREGLSAQDRVVVSGLHRARPGSKVTAELARPASERPQLAEIR